MNANNRLTQLEATFGKPKRDERDEHARLVMMELTIGGLRPDDPSDNIESRYRDRINHAGLPPCDRDTARIDVIRTWYRDNAGAVGWRTE
jgi:hypothetical protein